VNTLAPLPRRSMTLLPRWETPFAWMPEGFNSLVNRFFNDRPMVEVPEWEVTVEENEKEMVVRAELPGFETPEIRVEVLGGRLTIEAEHREPAEGTEEGAERAHTRVRRVIVLPEEVEVERAEALYRNGVLTVRVPRRPEALPRRIEVKV